MAKTKGNTAAHRARRPEDWKAAFLASLAETGNIRQSARSVGIDRATAYRHRAESPAFAEAWDDAIEDAADTLEEAAWQRAKGVEKPVYDRNGNQVGTEIAYDTTLLIFLLKGLRPEKYRDLNANALADAITRRLGTAEPAAVGLPGPA